ncbi:MAG: FMN-binding protein [Candidatus Cloacimonetes bacterium]|nr:FMN-binding protein [Candidatus Cloacimonadota bacterium]
MAEKKEKKSFSETRVYPIIFMIIVALFFGSILAVFYHSTTERIQEQRELRLRSAILALFDLPLDDIQESYERYIIEQETAQLFYYIAQADTLTLGYCFPISGTGLWGGISALLAVNNDFNEIIAFHILDQNETPGLGGRITEESFQNQFADKEFIIENRIIEFRLVSENEPTERREVNQITGATASSQAVVSMIYRNLRQISQLLEISYE